MLITTKVKQVQVDYDLRINRLAREVEFNQKLLHDELRLLLIENNRVDTIDRNLPPPYSPRRWTKEGKVLKEVAGKWYEEIEE